MQVFQRTRAHLFCGHWNGSPLEIGVTSLLREVPGSEVEHDHAFREYYVVLEGRAELEVNGRSVPLDAGTVVMVEPGERHRVTSISAEGVRWVIIKERSLPDSKRVVSSPV